MIQINLLPDVKVEYLKSRRMRRLVMTGSFLAIIVSLGILAFISSYVFGVQKALLANLDKKIATSTTAIKKIDSLDKILTIQNQLQTLDTVHEQKPAMTRLFTYLPQITPTDVQVSDLSIKFEGSTISLRGNANSVGAVNKFVDTLKFTTFTTGGDPATSKNAFSNVVLTKIGVTSKGAEYGVDFAYDPAIFAISTDNVVLVVPKITTTRSQLNVPDPLFKVEQPAAGATN